MKFADFIPIIIATFTIFFSSLMGYYFSLKKDSRKSYTTYRKEILEKIYIPIYKILIREVYPSDGYESIHLGQLSEIETIVRKNPALVDPKLDSFIWSFIEDAQRGCEIFDEDRALLNHVTREYNELRKSMGLPYEKRRTYKRIKNMLRRRIYRLQSSYMKFRKHK